MSKVNNPLINIFDRIQQTELVKEFPPGITFKHPWRKYQQRVLDELQGHLSDRHLHIIAPPGSGKTILGLEVVLRLNQPALILAPTIAIRNQWIQRFCETFLQTTIIPAWISRNIRRPEFLTVITYQGLHAACNNLKPEEEDLEDVEDAEESSNGRSANSYLDSIVAGLQAVGIKTIVADEAHHLRNEWWHTLNIIKQKIEPTIVGLTATPPYDVTVAEWQRYLELNGQVDAEISVPELIIEDDLCPHQDYVYFTIPTEKESKAIAEFRHNIERLFREISKDVIIIKALEGHPAWIDPASHLEWIYNNLSFFSATLIFLHANGREIPEGHLEVIGDKKFRIPELNYEWIEILLDFFLNKEQGYFQPFEEHQKDINNRLKRYGAIERKQINFSHNKRITGFLTSSISKLNGIKDITAFEYNQCGKDLRMVILTDFIRKEFFLTAADNNIELNKIGVIPIFEKLRRELLGSPKIGVLTGTLIIIPKNAFSIFQQKASQYNITSVQGNAVPYDENYILIDQTEQLKNDIVHIVTQIFQEGAIEILIGTKSLLGEGWDAPAVNSLILASFVGSFVLSNQMRGRAIRTQNGNTKKTGNIWHLACIDPTSPTGGDDFDLLKRRFRSFSGVSFREESGIENGIHRLNLPENIYQEAAAKKKNEEMMAFAADRDSLKHRWIAALETGVTLTEEIKIPFREIKPYETVKSLYFNRTIAYLTATLGSGLMGFSIQMLQSIGRMAKNIKTLNDLATVLAVAGCTGVAVFGRLAYRTLKLYLKYRDIAKDIQQIGEALLHSLIQGGIIHTDISKLKAEAQADKWGTVFCHLEGGTTFEKSTFINALYEIVMPINNPRYVIIRKNSFLLMIQQKDFHAVPEIIGRNKDSASFFCNQWEERVGDCELVYARTLEGRKLLLQARIKSLSAQFDNEAELVNKWR